MVIAVFVAAGISSRFGGRIKALAKVGPNGETLLDISMSQAKNAGVDKFVLIVSKQTHDPIKSHFGDSFDGVPIAYRFQKTPGWREKPLGHGHAFLAAKDDVDCPAVLASTDDLFGQDTWNDVVKKVKQDQCIPGYRMENVLPSSGKVNRGMMLHEDHKLTDIEEQLGIEREDIPSRYSGKEFAAMMMYGAHPEFFDFLEREVESFVEKKEPRKEILTGDVINRFVKDNPGSFHIVPTDDTPLFLTFPEDEQVVRSRLKQ